MPRPELAPPLDGASVDATIDTIRAVQRPDGSIPWFEGGHADPWDHVEAAMALTAGARWAEAESAYRWLARMQREDGSWAAGYRDGSIVDATVDANFCAYIAAGLWHHTLAGGGDRLLAELWPTVERALEFVLRLQAPGGEVFWALDAAGRPWAGALLTSSSCIHLSLRCALAAAAHLGHDRPGWERAAEALARAVGHRPEAFEDKRRWSMDWYYPVLSGVITGASGRVRLAAGWSEFVVAGRGVRCVADRPWVTAAETCELVLALDAAGRVDQAWELFRDVQHLRAASGGYWTGATFPEGEVYPEEQTTWTAAAVVLAADALMGLSPAAGLFRGLHDDPTDELLGAVAGSA